LGRNGLLALRQCALNGETVFMKDEIAEATESCMKMEIVLKWLLDQKVECVGSLEEADLQLVKLENDRIVDGIISENGDEFMLGAQMLYCKMKQNKNGEYQFKLLDREKFFLPTNPYK
jgi:hypothetical protein